ncbi:MAG: DUF222 domain-containing protein [Candidatus Nanopelagicales bacterium]
MTVEIVGGTPLDADWQELEQRLAEGWSPLPSAEEIALADELRRLWQSDDEDVERWDDAPGWARDDEPEVLLGTGSPEADHAMLGGLITAAAAQREGCGAFELALLESVDPASLDDPLARIAFLKVLDRLEAAIAARRYDVVLSLVPVMAQESDHVVESARQIDIAAAGRTSIRAGGQLIDAARATRAVFPGMHAALAAGRVSDKHVRILLERTRVIQDAATLVLIGEQALPLAERLTPPRFTEALEAVIIAFDPDAPARRRQAHAERDVWTCTLPDGMSFLGIKTDASTVAAMYERIRQAADALHAARGGAAAVRRGDADAAKHACRADAAAALILGTHEPDGSVTLAPDNVMVHVQLVIDLETLRGERDNPVLLDGAPIPAAAGRCIAGYAAAFRRIVTDPVNGSCLDYGREQYLPRPLRDFVLHRDGGCRIPGCGCRRQADLQLDHALPFPHGPSTPANTGAISTRCHQVKTAGLLQLVDGRPDGSVTLITMLGQRISIPPRPYVGWQPPDPAPPPGPDDPGPNAPVPDDDVPPF